MFPKPTYKRGGTNPSKSKPSKNDRAMVSGVSSILRKIKDKKNRKEVAGDMVNQFNREGVNYNKEKFLKNSRSFAAGGPVKPIYTSNRNDPRLKKYNDSLISYNEGEAGYNQHKATVKARISKNNAESYMWENPLKYRETSEVPVAFRYGWKNSRGITPISSTEMFGDPDESGYLGSLRESYLPTKKARKFYATEAYRYKKPVQPVIYKPAPKKSTMTTMSRTPVNKPASNRYVKRIEPKEESTTPTTTPVTITPVTPTQTPKQVSINSSQMQRYNYMSTEDKKRAVKKYGDSSKVPNEGIDINQLRKEVPTFQFGGASRADSLNLLANTRAVQNYYAGKNYKRSNESMSMRGLGALADLNATKNEYYSRPNVEVMTPTGVKLRKLIDYYQRVDNNKFYQRESANTILDTRAPRQLFDRRIEPTSFLSFNNINTRDPMHEDAVVTYSYDPISITPWDMLNTQQRKQRIDKYGFSGTPYKNKADYINKTTTAKKPKSTTSTITTISRTPVNKPTLINTDPRGIVGEYHSETGSVFGKLDPNTKYEKIGESLYKPIYKPKATTSTTKIPAKKTTTGTTPISETTTTTTIPTTSPTTSTSPKFNIKGIIADQYVPDSKNPNSRDYRYRVETDKGFDIIQGKKAFDQWKEKNASEYQPYYKKSTNAPIDYNKGRVNEYLEKPTLNYKSGGQHGGLDRWFAEKWVDVKSGKPCGRQEGENRAYPACRPSKRISSKTPKTSSELSSQEKARFKSAKTSSQRIPYNHKRMQLGAMNSSDSTRHQANKILKYEQLRGGPGGTPLPQYSDPKYMNMLMNDIYPEVKKIMPNATAMEAGEAMDFIFNAGWDKENKKILKDPRAFALQEYYRQYDKSKLDKEGNWPGRKQPITNELYTSTIGKLPENQRRILMNKGRDWYYKNTNNPAPGVPNPNYGATWYGRIWNTNDFLPFNPNNPKFIYKNK